MKLSYFYELSFDEIVDMIKLTDTPTDDAEKQKFNKQLKFTWSVVEYVYDVLN